MILSDAAARFDIQVHASCWVHIERPLTRLVPSNEARRVEIERLREQIWEGYKELKAYQAKPDDALEGSFWAILGDRVSGLGQVPRLASEIVRQAQETAAGQGSAATRHTTGGSAAE